MRIKLGAIAKDEGAYLPAWLFHHLHAGFDEIEVIVNNTSDNSIEILDLVAKRYPVRFRDAGPTDPAVGAFQKDAYRAIWEASQHSASHLCFLDIDEFWTALDFEQSVHACVERLGNPDIVSFEWALKRSDNEPFTRPFQRTNALVKNGHLKSLFRVDLPIQAVQVHNVLAPGASNVLADGTPCPEPYAPKIASSFVRGIPLKPYFIMHRFWRSEFEYIASLAQGRRQAFVPKTHPHHEVLLELRGNRSGFNHPPRRGMPFKVAADRLGPYEAAYARFLNECALREPLAKARAYREQRHGIAIAALRKFWPMRVPFLEQAVSGLSEDNLRLITGESAPKATTD